MCDTKETIYLNPPPTSPLPGPHSQTPPLVHTQLGKDWAPLRIFFNHNFFLISLRCVCTLFVLSVPAGHLWTCTVHAARMNCLWDFFNGLWNCVPVPIPKTDIRNFFYSKPHVSAVNASSCQIFYKYIFILLHRTTVIIRKLWNRKTTFRIKF